MVKRKSKVDFEKTLVNSSDEELETLLKQLKKQKKPKADFSAPLKKFQKENKEKLDKLVDLEIEDESDILNEIAVKLDGFEDLVNTCLEVANELIMANRIYEQDIDIEQDRFEQETGKDMMMFKKDIESAFKAESKHVLQLCDLKHVYSKF